MLISIVIPVFNKAECIALTLESVLNQSFPNFEAIVVDDGSTDGSPAIVEQNPDRRVRLLRQTNSGVSAARNAGIQAAAGDWVCFLDGDDWYHPDYLANVMATSSRYPEAGVIACRFKPMADSRHWRPDPWPLAPGGHEVIRDLPSRWMTGIPFFTGSIAVRRDILDRMQPCFAVGECYGEDMDLWFRIAERHDIVLYDQPLVAYRTARPESLSQRQSRFMIPPFLARLQGRARDLGDPAYIWSVNDFVVQQYVTQARAESARGERAAALGTLWSQRHIGLLLPRWWTTLLMVLCASPSTIGRWQHWRKTRKYAR